MRKALFTLICLFAMMAAGSGLKAQEITITLNPGWTWIGYTNAEAMSISAALGDFVPMSGDMIKSKGAGVTYLNGRWLGGFQQFIPGCGYHYYSNRTEPVSFVFAGTTPQVTVTTTEPTDVTATSAVVGGTVNAPEGTHVFLRGVCWSTTPNPDIDGNNTSDGTGIGSFSSTLEGLTTSLTYYVRAYAVTVYGLVYGNEESFTTEACGSNGSYNGHDFVDLGLPSGTLWATCNVGADTPEDYGDYFAWGETQPKDAYNWSTYQYCMGSNNTLTKYCSGFSYGYNGFTDDLTILLPEDDAATDNWGSDWRVPTKEEWQELLDNTTMTWTTQNGVNGRLFTAANGSFLFLPAVGYSSGSSLYGAGSGGCYWSSSLYTGSPYYAWYFYLNSDDYGMAYYGDRYNGFTVRAVRSAQTDHAYVDLGLPSGLLWATCNVGADAPEEYGDYFAWGETQPKDTYNWTNYQYCNGSSHTLTKYCNSSSCGYNGFTDNLTILEPIDDAATANWGSGWRMPTNEEWQELYNNTTYIWMTRNGVNGRLFTASNGNSLFLPAAGCRRGSSLNDVGSYGDYWSSSLQTSTDGAWFFFFNSDIYYMGYYPRQNGLSVRAVRSSR